MYAITIPLLNLPIKKKGGVERWVLRVYGGEKQNAISLTVVLGGGKSGAMPFYTFKVLPPIKRQDIGGEKNAKSQTTSRNYF